MNCYDPSERCYHLKDVIIGIDFGKNGDEAVQVTAKKGEGGVLIIESVKTLTKPKEERE